MKLLALSLLVTTWIAVPLPPTASTSLAVDAGASDVEITIEVTFLSTDSDGPEPVVFGGGTGARARLDLDAPLAPVASSLRPTGGTLTAADTSFMVTVGGFVPVNITLATMGMAGSFSGERWTGTPVAAGTTALDLTGSQLVFDQGILQVTSALGNQTNDLSVTPLAFDLVGPATLLATENGPGLDLELSIPLDQSVTVMDQGVTVTVTLTGSLVLRGRAPLVAGLAPVPILFP